MIIKSVSLENFLSHKDTIVEFDRGVNVIIGPNGAGKTSIVDAIIFALFSDRVRGDRINDIIRRDSKEAKVELEFVIDNKEYKIENVRSKTTSDIVVYENGNTLAMGKNNVAREVTKILEMSKDIALNSVFVRQGEIALLLDQEPSKRKEFIGKLLGLDKLEYTYDNMRNVIDKFKEDTKEYDRIKVRLDEKGESLKGKSKEKEELEIKNEKRKQELEIKSEELERAEEELKSWNDKRDRYNESKNEISTIGRDIKNIERRISELEEELNSAIKASENANKLEGEIGRLEPLVKYKELISEYKQLKKDRKRLEDELEKVNKLSEEKEDNKEDYEEYNKLSEEKEELLKEEGTLRKDEIEYEKIITEIKNKKKEIEKVDNEIEKVEEDAKALGIATLEDKNKKLEEIDTIRKEFNDALDKLKDEKGRLNGRRKEISEYLGILGESNICPICKQELTEEHRENVKKEFGEEISYIKNRLVKIEEEITEKTNEIKRLEEDKEKIEKIDFERLIKLKEELKDISIKIKELEDIKTESSKSVSRLYEVRKRIEDIKSKLNELKRRYDKYISAQNALESHRGKTEIESELTGINNKIDSIEEEKTILEEKIVEIPKDLDSEIKRLKKLEEEYIKLETEANSIESLKKMIVDKRNDVEERKSEMGKIIKERDSLGYSDEVYKKIKDRKETVNNTVIRLKSEFDNINLQLMKLDNEIKEIENAIRVLEAKLRESEKIRELINKLESIRKAFSKDGIQRVIRRKLAPFISDAASNYLDEFNLELSSLSINEDFDITLMRGGEELPLRNISGGEKVAVAIALRLAIANALSNRLSTIIMDEPTVHLDEERRRELVDIMKSFSTNSIIPQLIIITHNRELEDVGDVVYNVEKVNGISVVKSIEL